MKARHLRHAPIIVALLTALALTTACAHFAAPKQLNPAGAVAFHSDRIVHEIDTLRDVTDKAQAAGVIKTNDARKVMVAVSVAAQAAGDLSHALASENAAASAKDKFIATIRTTLTDVQAQVDPKTQQEIAPYVTAVLTAIDLLQ